MAFPGPIALVNEINNYYSKFSFFCSEESINKLISDLIVNSSLKEFDLCKTFANRISEKINLLNNSMDNEQSACLKKNWSKLVCVIEDREHNPFLDQRSVNIAKKIQNSLISIRQICMAQFAENSKKEADGLETYRELQKIDEKTIRASYSLSLLDQQDLCPILFGTTKIFIHELLDGRHGQELRNRLLDEMLYTQEELFFLIIYDMVQKGKNPSTLEIFRKISEEDRSFLKELKVEEVKERPEKLMRIMAQSRVSIKEFNGLVKYIRSLFYPSSKQLLRLCLINLQTPLFSCLDTKEQDTIIFSRSLLCVENDNHAVKIFKKRDFSDKKISKLILKTIEFIGVRNLKRANLLLHFCVQGNNRELHNSVLNHIFFEIARNNIQEAEEIIQIHPCYQDQQTIIAEAAVKNAPLEALRLLSTISIDEESIRKIAKQIIIHHGIHKTIQLLLTLQNTLSESNSSIDFFFNCLIANVALDGVENAHQILHMFDKTISKEDAVVLATEWSKKEINTNAMLSLFTTDETKNWFLSAVHIHQLDVQEGFDFLSTIEDREFYGWAFYQLLHKPTMQIEEADIDPLLNHLERCDKKFHTLIRGILSEEILETDFIKALSIIDPIQNEEEYADALSVLLESVEELASYEADGILAQAHRIECDSLWHKAACLVAKDDLLKALAIAEKIKNQDLFRVSFNIIILKSKKIDPKDTDILLTYLNRCVFDFHDDILVSIAYRVLKNDFLKTLLIIEKIQSQEKYAKAIKNTIDSMKEVDQNQKTMLLTMTNRCNTAIREAIIEQLKNKTTNS